MLFATTAVFADGSQETAYIPAPNWHDAIQVMESRHKHTAVRVSARPLDRFRPVTVAQAAQPAPSLTITPVDTDNLAAYDRATTAMPTTAWLGNAELAQHLPTASEPLWHKALQLAGGITGVARNAWALYSFHRRAGRGITHAARRAAGTIWADLVDPVLEVRL